MTSNYLDILKAIHQALQPKTYFEIGVRHGNSFLLSKAESIGIDPAPELRHPVKGSIYKMTSDEYFAKHIPFPEHGINLAFIDGMHLFEFALRDFINVESNCTKDAVIIFDDVLPRDASWATRERKTRLWTGDVWKIVPTLQAYRPDLKLTLIDSDPGGLLLVSNLCSENSTLNKHYNKILSVQAQQQNEIPPQSVINRTGAIKINQWLQEQKQ